MFIKQCVIQKDRNRASAQKAQKFYGGFMSGSGRLQSDPLFQGLTRPTMILGVSYMYFIINAAFCLITFINTQNFIYILVLAPIIHMIGFLICKKEPRALEMLITKLQKGYKCINRGYHGQSNSYDPF